MTSREEALTGHRTVKALLSRSNWGVAPVDYHPGAATLNTCAGVSPPNNRKEGGAPTWFDLRHWQTNFFFLFFCSLFFDTSLIFLDLLGVYEGFVTTTGGFLPAHFDLD